MTEKNNRPENRQPPAKPAEEASSADRLKQPGPGAGVSPEPRPVSPRRERYLVAPVPQDLLPAGLPSNITPIDPANLIAQLNADPTTEVVRVISSPRRNLEAFGNQPIPAFPDVAVVEMDNDRAAMFASTPLLHVEPDLPLQYETPGPLGHMEVPNPGVTPSGEAKAILFEVRGSDEQPLEGAEVYVMSSTFPVRGVTGPDGRVELAVPTGALASVTGLYVKPRYDYWSTWHSRPQLVPGTVNLVVCQSLTETFPGFPAGGELDAWYRRAMRLDALPPTFRGNGIKIAIIDSGAAVDHPDLAGRFAGGRDITTQTDGGWQADTMGHGSHCAGIIGGRNGGTGVSGIAPEAELHSCKVFPGGNFSHLIEALDYCIAHNIDVVNLSLGSAQPSALVARKIEQARQSGVACVVAAGNSGGPVSFPASMPGVLAVAAIGKIGEYPPESYHATQVFGAPTAEGYFSAKFTCHGPEISVGAPGVAIVSSVPPANYASWDGTSFAAPCVAGLAALVLAHHPDFRTLFSGRSAARVDRLFDIIRHSCRPLAFTDPGRSGAGLPDALLALGLVSLAAPVSPAQTGLAALWAQMFQAGLLPSPMPMAGVFGPMGPAAPASAPWAGPRGQVPQAGAASPSLAHPGMGVPGAGTFDGGGGTRDGAVNRDIRNPAQAAATATEALAPLRTALRAAGLLVPAESSGISA